MNWEEEYISWVNQFQCNCGNSDQLNFRYAFTMADGEVWNCNECKEDIIVEEEPEI